MSEQKINLQCKVYENGRIPTRADPGAAGYDLYSAVSIKVEPWTRALVPLEISLAIPHGYYGSMRARSGLSLKGIDIGAGVIDSSYRGKLGVCFINNSDNEYQVNLGDRVAQLIVEPCVMSSDFELVTELSETGRGLGGFGSTGR